jgi:hypothetical protein
LKITDLIWLIDIVDKLERKHGVTKREVFEIFANKPHIRFVEKGHYPDENVYAALGQTESGRYLIVYFVFKQNKRALIISSRDMTEKERRNYERR